MAQRHPVQSSHPSDPRQRVSAHYHQQPYPQPVVYPPAASPQSHRSYPPRRPRSQRPGGRQKQVLVAGGSMLALAALVVTPSMNRADNAPKTGAADVCIKQIDKQSLVSRDELKSVLELGPNTPKAKVRAVVDQPHCVLEARAGENGAQIEREAYPLEFDPQTWFVLQYQGEEFVGFDFSFR